MVYTRAGDIVYGSVKQPEKLVGKRMPQIPERIYENRLVHITEKMRKRDLDFLLIYADREHFANFEYVCGFEPRYEEAVLLIKNDGDCSAILGNECYPLHVLSKIRVKPYLYQVFSLPNQPWEKETDLAEILARVGVRPGSAVGIVGWKLFPGDRRGRDYLDIPYYIVRILQKVCGGEEGIIDANDLFISPQDGLRTENEAEQIAAFEYASSVASNQVMECMEHMRDGVSEMEMSAYLNHQGMPMTSHPVMVSGENAVFSLSNSSSRILQKGKPVFVGMSLRGGLTCRAGYLVNNTEELSPEVRDYIERIVKPYYALAVTWLENIGIGVSGGEIYEMVEKCFPRKQFGWELNPGHLTGNEEWLSSPIYQDSSVLLRSGMIIQQDIIPANSSPYFTTNIEDGILLADEVLRNEIQEKYPDMWERMCHRREYMRTELGIVMKPEVLPMSNSLGVLRPYFMNHRDGMKKRV
ncbi:MAG: M24 family metallopeptidase [Lachnospiraceae bacterium]|nr:M24 family metallopeptidase [Lachnospiraceae bacterium]